MRCRNPRPFKLPAAVFCQTARMSLRANWLVALRAVLALASPFIFIPGNYRLLLFSVALMVITGVTDLLDGQIARHSGKTSAGVA